jgi:hypothetical protein
MKVRSAGAGLWLCAAWMAASSAFEALGKAAIGPGTFAGAGNAAASHKAPVED